MELTEFLTLSAGEWFAQRTSYDLEQKQEVDNSKANLAITILPPESQEVSQLCQQFNIAAQSAWGATKMTWDNSVDWGKPKQTGSTLVVYIPDAANSQQGQILRKLETTPPQIQRGSYSLSNDPALTLMITEDQSAIEERQSFASENLRLRTTLVKNNNNCQQTAFYSEIRRILPKPEESKTE